MYYGNRTIRQSQLPPQDKSSLPQNDSEPFFISRLEVFHKLDINWSHFLYILILARDFIHFKYPFSLSMKRWQPLSPLFIAYDRYLISVKCDDSRKKEVSTPILPFSIFIITQLYLLMLEEESLHQYILSRHQREPHWQFGLL